MPDKTLKAFADHGEVGENMPADGGDAAVVLSRFEAAGFDLAGLAAKLQSDGAAAFVRSWTDLIERLQSHPAAVA